MKKSIFLSVILFALVFTIDAQNDTMYIMKNGVIVGQYNVNTDVDSMTFFRPTLSIPTSGTFTDTRDNTVYNWVRIGNQIWMAENLKYLPSVVGPGLSSFSTPCYYVYGYNDTNITIAKQTSYYTTYGVLYNWSAAMNVTSSSTTNPSGVQGVCPDGWHLPSDAEWTELTDYLGGESVAGGKLKDTTLWDSPNIGATNETGFLALPGGYSGDDGAFHFVGSSGTWWSASESSPTNVWRRYIYYNQSNVYRDIRRKGYGLSVRCVRD